MPGHSRLRPAGGGVVQTHPPAPPHKTTPQLPQWTLLRPPGLCAACVIGRLGFPAGLPSTRIPGEETLRWRKPESTGRAARPAFVSPGAKRLGPVARTSGWTTHPTHPPTGQWRRPDLNRRPLDYESSELPAAPLRFEAGKGDQAGGPDRTPRSVSVTAVGMPG